MNPQQNTQTPRFKSMVSRISKSVGLILVVSFSLGALLGYLYADRNTVKLSRQLETAQKGSVIANEKVYVNEKLDFSLILPDSWVKRVVSTNNQSSANFYYENGETGDKRRAVQVFTIYRCPSADFETLRGNTTDINKCPGRFLDRGKDTIYTWKEITQKTNLDPALKNSSSVIDEFNRQVAQTFRIVN